MQFSVRQHKRTTALLKTINIFFVINGESELNKLADFLGPACNTK